MCKYPLPLKPGPHTVPACEVWPSDHKKINKLQMTK